MSLPSSMADFVPCDRLLQKAYCAFYDKRMKLCMFVGLHEVNNFGYRGMAEKVM